MTIGCNILNAVGGTPGLNEPGFLPRYPGPLPMGIGDLAVPLQTGIASFESLFRRNAFVDHYTNEGVETDDFQAALRAAKRQRTRLEL